jgi:hypothetical protein
MESDGAAVQVEANLVQCVGPRSASCNDAIRVEVWRERPQPVEVNAASAT